LVDAGAHSRRSSLGDVALAVARDGNGARDVDETNGPSAASGRQLTRSPPGLDHGCKVKTGTNPYERFSRMAMDTRGAAFWSGCSLTPPATTVFGERPSLDDRRAVPTLLENDNTNKIFEPAVAINPDGSRALWSGI